MAWSDAMKLEDFRDFRADLQGQSGCYEIGHVRAGYFYAKYAGKASCLWDRISTYNSPSKCHNIHIAERHLASDIKRRNLYFHIFRTRDFAAMESRLLSREGIGLGNMYRFNQKYEAAHEHEDYSRAATLKLPDIMNKCSHCTRACPRQA
ncbi:hypothetical protein [Sandaracinobacteroides saxicola]|uniref:Uncharacterized protein n=1 Tax=Sandaracinobacteroides saxicola TaxID=2759707 RepID=A0A7G5IID4_9SPHN|nr:hypothetical protein [Sandaracinobacteroides saxicola]QMW23126.1 hypothetical protein H3309_01005 [Sandaracinobacteroides saxicola]